MTKPAVKATATASAGRPVRTATQRARATSSFETGPSFTARAAAVVNTGGLFGVGDVNTVGTVANGGLSEAEKFDHYAETLRQAGGLVPTKPGTKSMVGIRFLTDPSNKSGKYDDALALLWVDKAGAKHVREYKFNTEPTPMFSGGEGVDVNGDGRKDLARLRVGTYQYAMSTSQTYGNVLRPQKSQVVDRDVDGSMTFSQGYSSSAGTSILFHAGFNNDPGNKGAVTLSAGCQTLPPDEMKRLYTDLKLDGGTGRVSYTLVNGQN